MHQHASTLHNSRCANARSPSPLLSDFPSPSSLFWASSSAAAASQSSPSLYVFPFLFCRTAPPSHLQRVALLTQLSVDRVPALLRLARTWRGPISAAVLVRTPAELAELYSAYLAHPLLQSHVTFHVCVETDDRAKYPVNLLRNVAMRHEFLEFVLMLDVDFVGNEAMQQELQDVVAAVWDGERAREGGRFLAVVPAFEMEGFVDEADVPREKARMARLYERMEARQVHYLKGVHAHQPTHYARWMMPQQQQFYEISYDYLYEPYYVVRRAECPWYDQRFVGYGNDKASHAYEMAAAGFQFFVAPRSFIVHQDHGEPSWRADQSSSASWEMWFEFIRDMAAKYPDFKQTIPAWLFHSCLIGDCPTFWEWEEIY